MRLSANREGWSQIQCIKTPKSEEVRHIVVLKNGTWVPIPSLSWVLAVNEEIIHRPKTVDSGGFFQGTFKLFMDEGYVFPSPENFSIALSQYLNTKHGLDLVQEFQRRSLRQNQKLSETSEAQVERLIEDMKTQLFDDYMAAYRMLDSSRHFGILCQEEVDQNYWLISFGYNEQTVIYKIFPQSGIQAIFPTHEVWLDPSNEHHREILKSLRDFVEREFPEVEGSHFLTMIKNALEVKRL